MKKYDAIVIGSGQSGTPMCKRLAKAGWKTALIEKRYIGGTCVNDGCTPTKAMVSSAKMAYQAHRSNEYGVNIGDISVNMPAVIERKQQIVVHSRNGSEEDLKKIENLDLFFGTAAFTGNKQIEVTLNDGGTEELQADYIFIDTGTHTTIPKIDGLNDTPYFTSTTLLDFDILPEHLVIIGASYIGLEFGQMYKRFGSKVTILETSERFLSKEDEDIAEAIADILKEDKITLHTKAKVRNVKGNEGNIQLALTIDGKETTIDGSHLLIAAGRTPNTKELQPEKSGIALDEHGYIKVNDKLETNVAGIYAMGDVKGGPAFTHISYNDYIIVCENILEKKNSSIKDRVVPYCMFMDPQLGRVGMTEQEARKQGKNILVAKLPMKHVARAIETSETRGLMKALVDADTKKILGVAILGAEGGEIMSVLQMAMLGGITYDVIRTMVIAHPTFSESLNNLFMTLDNKS